MTKSNKIQKLPSDLINKIAAGEVIERPASIVKELLDNAIDAGANKIAISIEQGGIRKIEVKDNGIGIAKDMLPLAFERHATSKISSIEDLNQLLTMGFRGEALSTMTSISEVTAISAVDGEDAYSIKFKNSTEGEIKPAARDTGTTITIENIFEKIPARFKFLKTETTEYRKILQIITPYFLIYPGIHFIFEKDDKEIYNLPAITDENTPQIELSRAKEVLKSAFLDEPIKLFYSGAGVEIAGYIAHPSYHKKRVTDQYIFVNDRPVTDRGIYKSIHTGYDRFIPRGEKMPFIISIKISPDLVDINVHPRKEEVRFINPYRLYSAVENTVHKALQRITQEGLTNEFASPIDSSSSYQDNAFSRLRDGATTTNNSHNSTNQGTSYKGSASTTSSTPYTKQNNTPTQVTYDTLFDSSMPNYEMDNTSDDSINFEIDPSTIINTYQLFNKYIFVEFEKSLWVIDQHAAAERITFEHLLEIDKNKDPDVQQMLVPAQIEMQDTEIEYLNEHQNFFNSLGFEFKINSNSIDVTAIPSEYIDSDIVAIFNAVFDELTDDERDLDNNSQTSKENLLATLACHSSIRSKQSLEPEEQKSLVLQLIKCENPYSCPHGRPIVWKQTLSELDRNFDRTY